MIGLSPLKPLASLSSIADAAETAAAGAASSAAGAVVDATVGPVADSLTKYVVIGLGLLLIAAGIFSFDKTKELLVSTGKGTVNAAKAGAAIAA